MASEAQKLELGLLACEIGIEENPPLVTLLEAGFLQVAKAGVPILFHKGRHSEIIHIQHFWMAMVAISLALARMVSELGRGPGSRFA